MSIEGGRRHWNPGRSGVKRLRSKIRRRDGIRVFWQCGHIGIIKFKKYLLHIGKWHYKYARFISSMNKAEHFSRFIQGMFPFYGLKREAKRKFLMQVYNVHSFICLIYFIY